MVVTYMKTKNKGKKDRHYFRSFSFYTQNSTLEFCNNTSICIHIPF